MPELAMEPLHTMPMSIQQAPVAYQQAYQFAVANPEALADVEALRPRRVLFVLVSGPESDLGSSAHTEAFAVAAAESAGAVVVAEVWQDQEDGPDRADSLAGILGSPSLSAQISTVDALDLPFGPTITVFALVVGRQGEAGHYGVGDGAEAVSPAPVEAP